MTLSKKQVVYILAGVCIVVIFGVIMLNNYINNSIKSFEKDLSELKTELNEVNQEFLKTKEFYELQVNAMENYILELEGRINRLSGVQAFSDTKTAYLTFDDGPGGFSNSILDILEEYQVKATFFVNGRNSDTHFEIYKRIVDEGHALGNHTYSHNYRNIYSSVDNFMEDFYKLEDVLYHVTGVRPNIMRFPGGSSAALLSSGRYTPYVNRLLSEGYQYFDWNVDSGDASGVPLTPNQIAANVMSQTTKFSHANILMHETSSTVKALPLIIEQIKALGYEFDILTVDSPYIHHRKR